MTNQQFNDILKNDKSLIERAIIDFLPKSKNGQDEVVDAMKYSLLNGGKRLRPIFCLEFANCFGVDRKDAVAFACAVEYIHTYSLIHDDLPCMDNDDFRRGKPSCHKQFGEATALLAGDALLTHASKIITSSKFDDNKKVKAVCALSHYSGVAGMLGGQVIDLKYEREAPDLQQILTVHTLKTGALIALSCILGCIAGGADDEKLEAAKQFAFNLGIAFQIKDDILDVLGDSEKLGKPVGSDAENNKTTYVSLVGLEKAQDDVEKYTKAAIDALNEFDNADFLISLAKALVSREM